MILQAHYVNYMQECVIIVQKIAKLESVCGKRVNQLCKLYGNVPKLYCAEKKESKLHF